MASSRSWPFDDDDRPSGSVRPLRPADLQAILGHLGDAPDQLLAGTGAGRPVVAMRAPASVGRPGGSAQAKWRRMRADQWATWIRTLPWRVAATLGIGAGGGVLGSLLAPQPGLVLGGLAAVAAGWGLRFRPSPEAVAWRRGAAGERRTARVLAVLERHGWAVLHDLAVPRRQANIDHLVIGPGGVFVIDSKQYRGRLQLDPSGAVAWPLSPRPEPAGRVVRGRPGRRGPARPGPGGGADRGRPRCPGPLGQGRGARCAGCLGQASAKHASPAAGGAGVRTGHRPGRRGPNALPRCCLTDGTSLGDSYFGLTALE